MKKFRINKFQGNEFQVNKLTTVIIKLVFRNVVHFIGLAYGYQNGYQTIISLLLFVFRIHVIYTKYKIFCFLVLFNVKLCFEHVYTPPQTFVYTPPPFKIPRNNPV